MDNERAYMVAPVIKDGYYRVAKPLIANRKELGIQTRDAMVHAVLVAYSELNTDECDEDMTGPSCLCPLNRLSRDCSATVYSVRESIRRLEECGLLLRQPTPDGERYFPRKWAAGVSDREYPANRNDYHYIAVPWQLARMGLDYRVLICYAVLLDRLPLHGATIDEAGIWQYFTYHDFRYFFDESERNFTRIMHMAVEAGLIKRRRVGKQRRWRVYVLPYTHIRHGPAE